MVKNPRLKSAIERVFDNDCVIYRHHYLNDIMEIAIYDPFWDLLLHKHVPAWAVEEQIILINSTIDQYLGVSND